MTTSIFVLSLGLLLPSTVLASDWRAQDTARAEEAWRLHPTEAAAAWNADPATTQAGFLRFPSSVALDAVTAPVWVQRLVFGNENAMVRAALVDAIVRTGVPDDETFVGLLSTETDASVRTALVSAFRKSSSNLALDGIRLGLSDADAGVRAEAARAAGQNPRGSELTSGLVTLLQDPQAEPRAIAARSLGIVGGLDAWQPLARTLSDANADVRLQAVHALARLDAERLAASFELRPLLADPDPRVKRAAEAVR